MGHLEQMKHSFLSFCNKKISNFWLELSLENVKLGNMFSYEESVLESGKPSTDEGDIIKR